MTAHSRAGETSSTIKVETVTQVPAMAPASSVLERRAKEGAFLSAVVAQISYGRSEGVILISSNVSATLIRTHLFASERNVIFVLLLLLENLGDGLPFFFGRPGSNLVSTAGTVAPTLFGEFLAAP